MPWSIWKIFCLIQSVAVILGRGLCIPRPDFQSGWVPIINGLEYVARLNIDHGLGEVPVLVDVSVKVNDFIIPASGFRPDHPVEHSGPVVYIYDDKFVNVSTSPIDDSLYRIIPSVPPRIYSGEYLDLVGNVRVRVRAWKRSTMPLADFRISGIQMKANTSKASDSYAEMNHYLSEVPCLVIVRMKMHRNGHDFFADGVGSSMQVFADVPDRTNAYLVYGYSNTTFRLWVDSSFYGAIFDGRKHTWFDFVISEGKADVSAWRCSTVTPVYNKRVVTRYTEDELPSWTSIQDGGLEHALVRVTIQAEQLGGANVGFRFPGGMHIGYPGPLEEGNSIKPISVGGLSYGYEDRYKINFWRPRFDNVSSVFIADSFGDGTNTEFSNSESVYIQVWKFVENATCEEPIILHGFANTSNGTAIKSKVKVWCDDGYKLYIENTLLPDAITCLEYGYWDDTPTCLPIAKPLDAVCNPAEDKCRDQRSHCAKDHTNTVYRCLCHKGFKKVNGLCKAEGKYLPKPDYDSDWKTLHRIPSMNWYYELEHGLGTVPMLVDVQVYVDGYTFQAIGFRPDQESYSDSAAVVFIYNDKFINISATLANRNFHSLLSIKNYMWYGYNYNWHHYGKVRARAWKAESLPSPDIEDTTHMMRANTSSAKDSFYEIKHTLKEHPGIVVVRAKMQHDGQTFYANGVGSALNAFYNVSGMTTAFLVYGYSKDSIRIWVDASENGDIFNGKKSTKFDFEISKATIEIFAWKLSTLTPFFTHKFSLDDRFSYSLRFPVTFPIQDALNIVVAEITVPTANNSGFRFQSSAYMADRYIYDTEEGVTNCLFGGFTYAVKEVYSSWLFKKEMDINMLLFKPAKVTNEHDRTGSLVCIPESFGNGEYSDAVHSGVGILQSWFPADCGPPPVQEHGYIDTTVNGTELGSMAELKCDEGYKLSSGVVDNMPRCGVGIYDNIEWIVYAYCRPVECGPIESPLNGSINGTKDTFGSNITFGCNVGYKLHGVDVTECLSNGSWSAEAPICTIIECMSIEPLKNGAMNTTDQTFGSKVAFRCNAGYHLDGDEILECLSSGKWSAENPVCKGDQTSSSAEIRIPKYFIGLVIGSLYLLYYCVLT